MKKFKLITAGIICAQLTLMLSGCGGGKTGSDLTEVKVWSVDRANKAYMDNIVAEYNKNQGIKDGIKISYEVKEGDNFLQQIELALQSNQAPDIFPCSGSIPKFAENGYLEAFEDLPGGKELIEAKANKIMGVASLVKHNGKTYALPGNGMMVQGLIYNKDMFKAAGLVDENGEAKPPVTLKEFREYAKKLTNESKNEFGVIFPMKWSGWYGSDIDDLAMSSYGRTCYDPLTGTYDMSIYKEIWETFLGIKEDKSCFPGAEGMDNDPARARFAEGGIGMKISYAFDVGVLNDQFPAKCDWGVAPLPVADKDNCYKQYAYTGIASSINKKSVEKIGAEKIMKVYNELYRQEVTDNYNKLSENKKGYKEFAALQEISQVAPAVMPVELSGNKSTADLFVDEVWTGKISVDDALAKQTKILNDGVKKYKELNPDVDTSLYILDNWDIKR